MLETRDAAIGILIPFLGTALGACFVFFLRGEVRPWVQKLLLGFASGVMIAASVWSLIIPAIEMAEGQGTMPWLPAALGFLAGVGFLLLLVIYLLGMDEDHEFDGTIPTTEQEEGGLSK